MSGRTVTLIQPNVTVQKNDTLGSGVPYMPIGLAYTAAALLKGGWRVDVVDSFAEAPFRVRLEGQVYYQGLPISEIVARIPPDSKAVMIYAFNVTAHEFILQLIKAVKALRKIPVFVLENTQAVTSYHLPEVAGDFFSAGADFLIIDQIERTSLRALDVLETTGLPRLQHLLAAPGYPFREPAGAEEPPPALDEISFPAWELFPLENYWKLGYAHGPVQKKFLPLMTSRGCPYGCRFCVIPKISSRRWSARSAKNVVDEIEIYQQKFGVSEFHWEDLDPTIDKNRIAEICREIEERGLRVVWKLAAGTKVETLDEPTIERMAAAGCRYISISPESGSPRILKSMDKPFAHDLALRLVRKMKEKNIRSQACFVLGFPGETAEDLKQTETFVKALVKAGIDEIALFIMTPVPGSFTYGALTGFERLNQLTFSPAWRSDYETLARFRFGLYRKFLIWKILFRPLDVARQCFNFLTRNFETKMEMVPYRTLRFRSFLKRSGVPT